MFYSESLLLSKKGPLAKVWLAAHWERRLTKAQLLGTDIGQSVGAIISPGPAMPLALRLSGQLLLGVVRIYSRKAKYLLEDCNDALMRLKMTFRPGHVDLSTEDLTASRASINLPQKPFQTNLDIELLDINFDAASVADLAFYRPTGRLDAHLMPGAHPSDLDLPTALGSAGLNALDEFSGGLHGHGFTSDGPDVELDPNGNLVPRRRRAASIGSTFTIEVGRSALPPRPIDDEMNSLFGQGSDDVEIGRRQQSVGPDFDDFGRFDDLGDEPGLDLNMDLNGPIDLGFDLSQLGGARIPHTGGLSRLTPPPFLRSIPNTPDTITDAALAALTPNTRERIMKRRRADETQNLGRLAAMNAAKRNAKRAKLVIDSVTELDGRPNSRPAAASGQSSADGSVEGYLLSRDGNYLPKDPYALQMLRLKESPAHFGLGLHAQKQQGAIIFQAPVLGLPEAMRSLWTTTVKVSTISTQNKRSDKETMALGQSQAPGMPTSGGLPDFGDLPDYDDIQRPSFGGSDGGFFNTGLPRSRHSSIGPAPSLRGSRMGDSVSGRPRSASAFELNEVGDESEDILAAFRKRNMIREAPTVPSILPSLHQQEAEITTRFGKAGFSANTITAAKILEQEFMRLAGTMSAFEAEDEGGQHITESVSEVVKKPKMEIKFDDLTQKTTRQAATTMFFELLVLTTQKAIKVTQEERFGEIRVKRTHILETVAHVGLEVGR